MYDKSAETQGEYPKGTWRWEVEYKGDRAFRLAHRLASDHRPNDGILATVAEAYDYYGLTVPIDKVPIGWREVVTPHVSDDQRRLEWLERCIKPVVTKLSEAYGSQKLLETLGLHFFLDGSMIDSGVFTDVDLGINDG